jgi:hypothetical protein
MKTCAAPDIIDIGLSLRSIWESRVHPLVYTHPQHKVFVNPNRFITAYFTTVGKAIREYTAARSLALFHIEKSDYDAFAESCGRFETCINSTRRAMLLLDKIRSNSRNPSVDESLRGPSINRSLARQIESWEGHSIKPVRDSIEHIDERIMDGPGLVPGEPHVLMFNSDGDHLEIARDRLSLVQLATMLRTLHGVGCELIAAVSRPEPPGVDGA